MLNFLFPGDIMIVMQYRFTLPADYNMEIIQKRIRENGANFNSFPGLLFKFFLYSRKDERPQLAKENSYAPLYVWKSADAMMHFLQSQNFVKLTQDFGWPQIDTWLSLRTPALSDLKNMNYLSIARQAIEPHSDLNVLTRTSQLCALDGSRWQLLDVAFSTSPQANAENYHIGYIASIS